MRRGNLLWPFFCAVWLYAELARAACPCPLRKKAAARPAAPGAHARKVGAPSGRARKTYGQLPFSFEANHGQANSEVKFLARGSGYTAYLTADEAVLALRKGKSKGKSELPPPSVLRMHLLNANHEAKVTGLAEMPGAHNYFIGNDRTRWHASVPTYAKVAYQGVYPGVNLVYYGNPARRGQLEYDFVVAPGTDPRIIELAIDAGDQAGGRQKAERQWSVVSGQGPGTKDRD